MRRQEEILRVMAPGLRTVLRSLSSNWKDVEEIRLRVGQPLSLTLCGRAVFVDDQGRICEERDAHRVSMEEIRETMSLLSSYSRYAFEDKIRQGFLTIQGGHRVGLSGRVVLEQIGSSTRVKTIAPITFINLRIARQMVGCAEQVLPLLWVEGKGKYPTQIYDTLLVSPPGGGKTTLLRDLIRLLSLQG